MPSYQQREFGRHGWKVMARLWKLHGHLVWLLERAQMGSPLTGDDVDAFYARFYDLTDAIDAFRRTRLWRSVDFVDEGSDEATDE